jgi:hypothetical protein
MKYSDIDTVDDFEALVDQHMTDVDADSVKLLGVLFMREEQALAKEIAASLNYLDSESSDAIDFYLPGWKSSWTNKTDKAIVSWTFDLGRFMRAKNAFEEEIDWKYSAGGDLLLMTAGKVDQIHNNSQFYRRSEYKYVIDFTGVRSIPLHTLVKNNLIEAPDILFKQIFDFAKRFKEGDPVVGFMAQEVRVSAVSAITEGVFGLLPKEAKQRVDYAKHFVIKDVTKSGKRKNAIVKETEEETRYPG